MFGVDLLLFGHVHAYERTNPVSNYQADPSGCSPVYITIGETCPALIRTSLSLPVKHPHPPPLSSRFTLLPYSCVADPD